MVGEHDIWCDLSETTQVLVRSVHYDSASPMIFVFLSILLFSCNDETPKSESRKTENMAAAHYDSKQESDAKIFTSDIMGKTLAQTMSSFGEPSNSISISSTSAKGRMPLYLVNYLNSIDSLVTVKVCRWNNDTLSRGISYKFFDESWIAIGGHVIKNVNIP